MGQRLMERESLGGRLAWKNVPLVVALACAALTSVIATVLAPEKGFWLLLGLACVACLLLAPQFLCYALVPAVTLDGVLTLHAGPLRVGPTDFLVGALGVAVLVRVVVPALRPTAGGAAPRRSAGQIARDFARRHPNGVLIGATLVAYLTAIVLSGFVAGSRSDVLKEVLKWSEVFVVIAGGVAFLKQRARLRAMVWTMIGVGTIEALLGYGQWVLAAGDIGQSGSGIRVFGTFDQPNPYAAYLNLSLPIALAIAVLVRRASARWLAVGAAALLIGAQVLANSRGALLALAVVGVVVAAVAIGIARGAALAALAGAVLVAVAWVAHVLPVGLQSRILRVLRVDGVSLSGPVNDANFSSVERLAHWVAGIRMFVAHPVLGVGAGNYSVAYSRYQAPGWNLALGHAHDYYINAAAETGIVGLVAFLAFTAAILLVAWRGAGWERAKTQAGDTADGEAGTAGAASTAGRGLLARAERAVGRAERELERRIALVLRQTSEQRALALGIMGVLVGIAVHNLVDDLFVHGMELQMALCVALAITLASGMRPTRSSRTTQPD